MLKIEDKECINSFKNIKELYLNFCLVRWGSFIKFVFLKIFLKGIFFSKDEDFKYRVVRLRYDVMKD